MNMKDVIDKATYRAIQFNADSATATFYDGLREGVMRSTRCTRCEVTVYPPRPFCAGCGSEDIAWVELPRRGTLYAFSTQHRSLRFFAPDVLGLVELEGVEGLVFTKIGAPIETLEIGQQVEVGFVEVSPKLVLHEFTPVRTG